MQNRRFVGRREYFGCLMYDRQRGDYIPFDWDATRIFDESQKRSLSEVQERFKEKITPQNFQTFVQLCKSIELMDVEGRFTGELLPTKPVPEILSAPLRVHLAITNLCQLKCRHCSAPAREASSNELSLDEIKKLLDELAANGTMEVTIGGGEPFLRQDLFPIIAHARSLGLNVLLSTTGLFVSRVVAKKIVEVGLKSIRISFEGSTEKSYDYFRGKGTYRRAVRGIKTLREVFDVPITLHTVLMRQNINEILTMIRAVQKMKCNTWSVDFVKPIGFGRNHPEIFLSNEEVVEAINTIRRVAENTSLKIEMPQFPYKAPKKGIYRGFGCVGANLYCYVDPTGNVSPCSFTREFYLAGNIRNTRLKQIWVASEAFKRFRTLPGNETCFGCEYYNSCRGGCRARAIYAGDVSGVDPCCFLITAHAEKARVSSDG